MKKTTAQTSIIPLFLSYFYSLQLLIVQVITYLHDEKGAIIANESEEVALFVSLRDFLLFAKWPILLIVLGFSSLKLFWPLEKKRAFFGFLSISGLLLSLHNPFWTLLSIYSLFFCFLEEQKTQPSFKVRKIYLQCTRISGKEVIRLLPAIIFSGALASFMVASLEGYFFVGKSIGKGFTLTNFLGCFSFVSCTSLLYGFFLGLQIFAAFSIILLVEQGLKKNSYGSGINFWGVFFVVSMGTVYALQNYYLRYIWQWYLKIIFVSFAFLGSWIILKIITSAQKKMDLKAFTLLGLLTFSASFLVYFFHFKQLDSFLWKLLLIALVFSFCFLFVQLLLNLRFLGPNLFFTFYCSWIAFIVCAWLFILIFNTLKTEITALNLLPDLFLLIFAVLPLLAVLMTKNLVVFLEHLPSFQKSFSLKPLFLSLCASLFLTPTYLFIQNFPAQFKAKFLHLQTTLSLISIGILLFILYKLNYTDIVDYSDIAQFIYSQIIVGLLLIAILMLQFLKSLYLKPRLTFSIKTQFALLLLLFLSSSGWIIKNHKNDIYSMIIAEYSTIWQIQSEPFRLDYFSDRMKPLKVLKKKPFSFHKMPTLPKRENSYEYKKEKPPIFVVLWDAARPDRFSCYDYNRKTTPNVDEFTKDAVVFTQAYSNSTATSTGFRHLMTGKYSTRYMLEKEKIAPFWTNELVKQGYDHFFLNALGTFYNGIPKEAYLLKMPPELQAASTFETFKGSEPKRIENLFRLLDKTQKKDGFYALLHHVRTHTPWMNDSEATHYGNSYSDQYDNCVNYLDLLFGRFIQGLKKRGLYEKSIIILLADHGTGLNDHGRFGGFLPYQEQIRIPLIIKMPGVKPTRVHEPVSLIDIGPTLINLFKEEVPNPYHGVSLLPLMLGKTKELARKWLFVICAFEDTYAILDRKQWKCIVHRTRQYWQLYNLKEDPKERVNLALAHPELIAEFQNIFQQFLQNGVSSYSNPYHYRAWEPQKNR